MPFVVKQEKFEGPLELLLELIDKQKLSISEISLAEVADKYVRHIKELGAIEPEPLAEFLVVAAQLMLIKSRSLLPRLELGPEEEASAGELEERLRAYHAIREQAALLRRAASSGGRVVSREAWLGREVTFAPPERFELVAMAETYQRMLNSLPVLRRLAEKTLERVVSLQEKIEHIRQTLHGSLAKTFSELTGDAREKVDVIVSFLALLELARIRMIDVDQGKAFEEITIRPARE